MRHVEGEKKHSQPFDLIDPHARVFLQARDFVHRDVIDKIGLAGFERRQPRSLLGYLAENDFLDRRFTAPVIVVAGKYHVAAALIANELVRAGADRIVVELVTELVAGNFAEDEAIFQTIEKNRQWL